MILADFQVKLSKYLPDDLTPSRDIQSTLELVPVDHPSAKHVVRTSIPLIPLKHRCPLNHAYPKEFYATIHILKFWRGYLLPLRKFLYSYHRTFRFYNFQKILSLKPERWLELWVYTFSIWDEVCVDTEVLSGLKSKRPIGLIPLSTPAQISAQHLYQEISIHLNIDNNMASSQKQVKDFTEGDHIMNSSRPVWFLLGTIKKLHT